jgi:hypothetical protein
MLRTKSLQNIVIAYCIRVVYTKQDNIHQFDKAIHTGDML